MPYSQYMGGDGTWTGQDRVINLAYMFDQAERCPDCGKRHADTDEEQGGDRLAWVAKARICLPCEAREMAYSTALENAREANTEIHGLKVDLIERKPKPPAGSGLVQRPVR